MVSISILDDPDEIKKLGDGTVALVKDTGERKTFERINYNVGEGKNKAPQETPEKRDAIIDALKYFKMIKKTKAVCRNAGCFF